MIRSFRCKDTQALFEGSDPRRFRAIKDAAIGQYSIRINRQWRVCFVWTTSGPESVEIVDYH